MQEAARDRLVIALRVVVHSADALIVAADDARQLLVDGDIGTADEQIGRRGEMRFVGPFGPRQAAREQSFADMLDFGIGSEESGSVFGHRSGPLWSPIGDRTQ